MAFLINVPTGQSPGAIHACPDFVLHFGIITEVFCVMLSLDVVFACIFKTHF